MVREHHWERVYGGIKTAIDQRKLRPGDRLPTEEDLGTEYGVGRNTIRTALRHLEHEGIINPARGPLGRTVADWKPLYWNLSKFEVGKRRDDPDTGTDEWAADMREQGREPRQVVDVTPLAAPGDIAAWLDVEPGTLLYRRRRLRLADDLPVSIADTWLPEDIAKRTVTIGDQQVYPWLEQEDMTLPGGIVAAVGIRQEYAEDEIYIRHAGAREAELLKVTPGTACGEHVRVGIDDAGRRIRVLQSVFPGHRLFLRYRLRYRTADQEDT